MKLLVVGDLHGNKPKIHFKDFDAIIAPGDFCSDERREYIFRAMREYLDNPRTDIEWHDYLSKREATDMLKKSIKDGRNILEQLNSFGKPVYVVPGNWEPMGDQDSRLVYERKNRWKDMLRGLDNLRDVHMMRKSMNSLDFIGYGVVSGPELPMYKEDEERLTKKKLNERRKSYNEKTEEISRLFEESTNPAIFMPHNVPFNTRLDKITNRQSPKYGYHFGSVIARELIEKYQPLLCIGGHMHEHFGKDKIGKTTCINAGFGSKVNTLIDLDEEKGKIRSIKFYPKTYG